jgi:hypothetical protein
LDGERGWTEREGWMEIEGWVEREGMDGERGE